MSKHTPHLFMSDIPAEVERLTGSRPHTNTVRRWRTIGVGGVTLKVIYVAGRFKTSPASLQTFLDRISAVRAPKVRNNREARRRLKADGIL